MSQTQRDGSFPFFDFKDFKTTLLPAAMPTEYAQGWLKAQVRALSAMQAMTNHWFDCRRQNLDAMLSTVGRLSACKDAGEIAEMQQQFLTGASERLASELTSLHEDLTKLTQSTASAVVESLSSGATPKKAA
jgi:hypothetical protein